MTRNDACSAAPYGQRLIPNLIDQVSKETPDRTCCYYPFTGKVADGYKELSYGALANGINKMAWWIEDHFTRSNEFETISYIGPPDLRYFMLTIAAQKTGYKVFLPSPRNSLEAQLNMLEALKCQIFLAGSPTPLDLESLFEARPMQQRNLPDLSKFIDISTVQEYPFPKSFDQAVRDPFVVLHTSGSTGHPKPVTLTHGAFASNDAWHLMPSADLSSSILPLLADKKVFLSLPPFHSAGMWCMMVLALCYGMKPVLTPSQPLTAELVDLVHVQTKPQVSILAPSIIEDLVKTPAYFVNMSFLDHIFYGGGPLSKEAGQAAMQKTSVLTLIGSTEALTLLPQVPDQENWQYIGFGSCLGLEFRHRWDDHYEMIIVRKAACKMFQAVFHNFPDLQEFPTRDLFSPHPEKPNFWLHRGRADDTIVFSNGEKLNPVAMEGMISLAAGINGCLIAGQGRFQSALLIEPQSHPTSPDEGREFVDRLWPIVQQANDTCPSQGRIFRDFVVFTSPDKPLLRASKGTIQRHNTLKLYEKELDNLYAGTGLTHVSTDKLDLDLQDELALRQSLHSVVAPMLMAQNLSGDDDLFARGLDSVQVATLVRLLNNALQNTGAGHIEVSAPRIYGNPTLNSLSAFLIGQSTKKQDQAADAEGERQTQNKHLDSLLLSLCEDFGTFQSRPEPVGHKGGSTIILTGSTGSIGSYLLDALLASFSVDKVICLNRRQERDPKDRQLDASKKHFHSTNLDPARVSFHEADFGDPGFGLPRSFFDELLHTVTHIVHNAWEVNFNLSLQSFTQPHILGVRHLIQFARASRVSASIVFLSTIGTAMHWQDVCDSPMPEIALCDWRSVQQTGYAQSKAVSERLLDHAASTFNLDCIICRIGQVAGPTSQRGIWNPKEWFPSLVKSSAFLNVLPGDLGPMQIVDWIPVDILAKSLVELALQSPHPHGKPRTNAVPADSNGRPNGHVKEAEQITFQTNVSEGYREILDVEGAERPTRHAQIYHLVNPKRTDYQRLLPVVRSRLPPSVRVVSLEEWTEALAGGNEADIKRNPAVKLLAFFQDLVDMKRRGHAMVTLDAQNACRVSQTLRGLGPVEAEWMLGWLLGWGFPGQPGQTDAN